MPRSNARKIQRSFRTQYLNAQAVGLIEGGDGTPVQINLIGNSEDSANERTALYGCRPGEVALLVEWVPADSNQPWPEPLMTFPRSFQGLPVYYRQGSAIFAH
jgi:hypothetical protein